MQPSVLVSFLFFSPVGFKSIIIVQSWSNGHRMENMQEGETRKMGRGEVMPRARADNGELSVSQNVLHLFNSIDSIK